MYYTESDGNSYPAKKRIRAIDRELSATAIQVLRAALEQGSDPEKAIASLRERNLSLQEERSRLLRGLGLPADWLTNRPMCEKCGDTGYEGAATCECVKRRYARLLKQQLSSVLPIEDQNFEKFNLSYYSPRIDPNMHDSPLENMRVNLFECKAYARNFGENSPNLLLYGSTGLGKTFLSTCVAEAVSARGFSVAYDTAINIIAAYETIKFGNGDGAAAAERAARYERADLLIIDDLGMEISSSYITATIYNVIDTRITLKKPTIISTNLSMQELEKRYNERFTSRIIGFYDRLIFRGKDIRMKKKLNPQNKQN